MLLVSMTQHGELSSHQSGMFGSSICFGITVGLWLAGLMDLAYVEVGIAMLLTAIWTAHIREFPFCGPEGKLEDSGTMTSSFCANEKPEKKKRSGEFGAVAAELERSASFQGKEHKPIARKPPLPKAGNMKGAESNLRVASIEQFLKKRGNSWRGWSKLGTRTLAKLEDEEHLNFNHLLPTV
eukprot:symbB.v1.2.021915.t1/scaffold1924.1/size95933/2